MPNIEKATLFLTMNSNTCQTSHIPVTISDNCAQIRNIIPKVVIGNNKIYSNYSSAKQTSSGSETDVSTSTENLTPEEHYVLKTGIRQEPQGEETFLDMNRTNDGILQFPNSLAIRENGTPLNGYNYMPPYLYGKYANNIYSEVKEQMPKNENYFYHNHSVSEQTSNDKSDVAKGNISVSTIDNDSHYSNLNLIKYTSQTSVPNNQLFIENESVIKIQSPNEQTKLPISNSDASVILQQPMLNNYLNSLKKNDSLMIKNYNNNNNINPLPPSNANEFFQISPNSSKSYERLAISRSHPDLTKFGDEEFNGANSPIRTNGAGYIQNSSQCSYNPSSFNGNNMNEMLIAENSTLRAQLDLYMNKVKKLQNFELEIQKVHQSHEEMMKSSEKKEKLEKALRLKLEFQLRRFQEENRCLKEQIDSNANKSTTNFEEQNVDLLELKKEISKRDILISRLLAQNKEYISDKERQEIELQAQRLTLQEQRKHIELLDTALMNAQNSIIILETEQRKKHEFEEKTRFLKKALSNLQLANDRRLQMEKRVRTQLEKEIEELKRQNVSDNNDGSPMKNERDVDSMKRMIREYEEKIITLEAEVSKWEQKYLEESTLRSIEVSVASAPRDAKIAALELTSQESEKMIAEARSERLKHMDEIHLANKKFTELESKLKDVESKLAEKDAMIKVLQKHSEDRDAVIQKTLVRRFPNRHTRSASTMGLVVSNSTTSSLATSSVNNSDALSNDFSKLLVSNVNQRTNVGNVNNIVHKEDNSESNMNNIDEQLKEIDSRLSPKDSIIKALRNEKERYPNHYNNWRL